MRRTLALATALLFGGGIALAGPAAAHDTRQHSCEQKAATLTDGTLVSATATAPVPGTPATCTIVRAGSYGAPVASGTINWEDPETRVVGTSETDIDYIQGELLSTSSTEPVHGAWETRSVTTTVPVVSKVGKSTNTKYVSTTTTHQERTVTTYVTNTYSTFEVTYQLQDIETFREGSEPTTISRVLTTRVYRFSGNSSTSSVATNPVPNTGTTPSTETVAGEPIAHEQSVSIAEDVPVVDETGEPVVASSTEVTPTVENGGVTTTEVVTTESQTLTTVNNCVENKNKSKNRTGC